ncbi:hypothetical protein ABPG75_002340 [Micractinium tetrahymenae]
MSDAYLYSSEDEFAAAADSEEEEAAGGREDDGMQLGNVVIESAGGGTMEQEAHDAPPLALPAAQALKLPSFQFASKRRQGLDGRVLLLFDINGVLMQHRWTGTGHQHDLRPGVHHLLRLLPHFRLGIYSSATRPTVSKTLSKLHNNLANFLEQRSRRAAEQASHQAAVAAATAAAVVGSGDGGGDGGSGSGKKKAKKRAAAAAAAAAAGGLAAGAGAAVDAEGFPRELPDVLFEVVMARDHCQPAAQEDIAARGGRPWDTVKPLAKYFAELGRVLLVDDSAHKAATGEGANMLFMPCWPGAAHPLGQADASLPLLVELLLAHAGPDAAGSTGAAAHANGVAPGTNGDAAASEGATEAAAPAVDVRRVSAAISRRLAEAAARQLEQAQAAGKLSSEEAAAAAAVVEAAVSGSAAVAAAAAHAEANGLQHGQPQEVDLMEHKSSAPSRKRQQPEPNDAAAAAAAAAPAAAAPAVQQQQQQQPLSKRQRRELAREQQEAQQSMVRALVLAAVSQLEASGGGVSKNSGGVTLADINAYLVWAWSHLGGLAFGKTAKPALVAAIDAGLLDPAGLPGAAEAVAAAAGLPGAAAVAPAADPKAAPEPSPAAVSGGKERRFKAGGSYCLSPAGAAAAPGSQYVAGLSTFCLQFGSQEELVATLQALQQQQQQQQQQGQEPAQHTEQQVQLAQQQPGEDGAAGAELAGFFWEEPTAEQQAPPPQQAQQAQPAAAAPPMPAVPPPEPAPADLAALQRSVLLHAVSVLQQRRGVSADSVEQWLEARLQPRHPELALFGGAASKAQKPQARTLRSMLQLGLKACEKDRLLSTGGFDSSAPPVLPLYSCTKAGRAAVPAKAELAAALASLAAMLGGEAPSAMAAAGVPAAAALQAAEGAAPAASAAAAAAAAPPDVPAGFPADVVMEEAEAEAEAAGGPSEAAPMLLLEVFEDRAPAPAAPPAQPVEAGAAAAAAPTELPGADEAELSALRALVQQLPPAQCKREQRWLEAAEASGLPLSEVKRISKAQLGKLSKQARKQAAKGAKAAKKLSAKQRRAAAATAQAALDRLFDAAVSGDAAAWAAACAGLSEEEREALATREVDLEDYRRKIAAAAKLPGADSALQAAAGSGSGEEVEQAEAAQEAGDEREEEAAAPSGSDWEPGSSEEGEASSGNDASVAGSSEDEGSGEEDAGSSSEDEGGSDGDEEAAAAAAEAAAAAHGGHYLRSCDREAAAAAAVAAGVPAAPGGGEEAQWFWERQQARQRHAQQQPQQQARPEAQRQGPPQQLSPLHYEVESFAEGATPTRQEVEAVQAAVLAVSEVARSLWPHSRTALFGSQATGLALPGSDLDIVVLNVGATLERAATGFTPVQRKQLSELLEDLLDGMLQRRLLRGKAQIIEARVPIIKCRLDFGGGLAADISLGAENGAQAVDFVRRQVLAVPPLRPLCLAVKAFLRERGQNEVFTGGLSSYSVFNMVMAHLQCEGYTPDTSSGTHPTTPGPGSGRGGGRGGRGGRAGRSGGCSGPQGQGPPAPPAADLHQTLAFLAQLAAGALPGMCHAARQQQAQQAQQRHLQWGEGAGGEAEAEPGVQGAEAGLPADLGVLLWGFFDRFGTHFSYAKHAVSIRMGGVCSKLKTWRHPKKPWLLAVEDPQEMGKDIGSGSYEIRAIKESFAEAAELLAEVCEDLDANQAAEAAATAAEAAAGVPQPPAAAAQQQQGGDGGRQLLLAGVLDVEAAVGRSAEAQRARAALETRAAAKSAAVLHQRIRAGVAVGRSSKPRLRTSGRGRAQQPQEQQGQQGQQGGYMTRKEKRMAQRAGSGQQGGQAGRQAPGSGPSSSGKQPKRRGSRRGAAVEAQWGSTRGQYKDFAEEDSWSLRKQKKAKKKAGGGAGGGASTKKGGGKKGGGGGGGSGGSTKKQKRGQEGGGSGGSAKKKARRG